MSKLKLIIHTGYKDRHSPNFNMGLQNVRNYFHLIVLEFGLRSEGRIGY